MRALLFLTFAATALAQSSADYRLTTTVLDDTGGVQSSADYAQLTTLGGIHGIVSDATPSVLRSGIAGQLYEGVALQLSPVNAIVNEGTSRQLSATLTLDDATTLTPAPNEITWTITSGPIASITPSGLATAAFVYVADTARISGGYGAFSELLFFNIQNTSDDNFGPYASDGLSDLWQVGWFGDNNDAGRADKDPDGDGQNNTFEFLSGYSPLDASAFLMTRALSWNGTTLQLELSRVQPGTVYDIDASPDLTEWTQVEKVIPTTLAQPFVQPLAAEAPATFFRVRLIQAP